MDAGAVIVFSDTHFGFEPESKIRFKNLLDWLTTSQRKVVTVKGEARTLEEPSKVILLGDILEYWTPRDADASLALKEGFENLRSLFAFAPEIVYVAGNHDHVIGSYADEYQLEPGSRLLVRPDHYPDDLSDEPGKKYKGEQIGDKVYFLPSRAPIRRFQISRCAKFRRLYSRELCDVAQFQVVDTVWAACADHFRTRRAVPKRTPPGIQIVR